MLTWARERAGRGVEDLAAKFPKLAEWEAGERQPTLRQLEAFSKAVHVPIGFLFLREPPEEPVPIPDFRTIADEPLGRPSPDLFDTLYLCQQRQDWYRDWARRMGEEPVAFVGSVRVGDDVERAAAAIRHALGFDVEARRKMPTWTEALRHFIAQAEEIGVLVMVSGVVGSNNRRKLDPQEFRGFALADPLAPLVFVNGADTKAAQMFTLAHELAHLWIAQSALSDAGAREEPDQAVERWCNRVAAELLVPMRLFRDVHEPRSTSREELDRLARYFKVSTLVILRRMRDAGTLRGGDYWRAYDEELARLQARPKARGGDFYLSQAARASRRFARAVVISTFEGHTAFTEAFRMLGVRKTETLRRFAEEVGVSV
ncbi:MAG TPA: ImmA/IrrE family metallo-endopeptidase [Deltaproteobacteria bacterium]|nr:ImmA/IrrE family metallo-endopeptidase [Deltaproteobacteria bacterium]